MRTEHVNMLQQNFFSFDYFQQFLLDKIIKVW